MKELEAEWAREAQGAPTTTWCSCRRSARPRAAEGASLVTCETAQRAPTSPSPSSLVTCTAGGRRRRVKSDSLVTKGGVENMKVTVLLDCK